MRVRLICVGKVREGFLKSGIESYTGRLKHYCKIEMVEIRDMGIKEEGRKILEMLRSSERIVSLSEEGVEFNSTEFAEFIKSDDKDLVFIIGGPDGLSDEVKERSDMKLSISRMTFTHEMVRLFLLEQIYRAFTIIKGKKYHR